MKCLVEKSIIINDLTINLILFKMYKSFLLLISDQKEMGIGSVTLGSPPLIEGLKSTTASYNLFGVNKKLLSTIISEKTSRILKAPVLLLLFLKTKKNEEEIAKPLMKFLTEMLTEVIKKNNY
jgi:hypothetical protein